MHHIQNTEYLPKNLAELAGYYPVGKRPARLADCCGVGSSACLPQARGLEAPVLRTEVQQDLQRSSGGNRLGLHFCAVFTAGCFGDLVVFKQPWRI